MAERLPWHRLVGLGASCALHVVLVGGAIAFGIDAMASKEPLVLFAELVPAAPPGPESAKPVARPQARRHAGPETLTPPQPIAPPRIENPAERVVAPERVEPPAPVTVEAPLRAKAEPLLIAAAPTSTESAPAPSTIAAASDVARPAPTASPAASGSRATAAPGSTAMAIPSGITQIAIPRGGYQVRPAYPGSARRLGIQGITTLRIHVAADGRVSDVLVEASAGHSDLDHAAMDAVKRWRFEPARRGIEAVGMWVLLPVEFRLK